MGAASPFDIDNLATWRKELAAGGSCETITAAYNTRLEEKKSEQLFANASTFAMIGPRHRCRERRTRRSGVHHTGKARTDLLGTHRQGRLVPARSRRGVREGRLLRDLLREDRLPEQHSVSRMLSGRARIDYQMTK
jgi:hypothetical protein